MTGLLLAAALLAAPAQPAAAPRAPAPADRPTTAPATTAPATAAPATTSSPGSPAAAAAKPGPVRIDAEEVRYSWGDRRVVFTGKPRVTMVRDDATLSCRTLTADNDEKGQVRRAVCEGDVLLVRGSRTVRCERAVYEHAEGRVTCEENAVLTDGGSEARGRRLVYDLAADQVSLEGAQVVVPADQVDLSRVPGARPAPGGTR